MKRLSKKFKDKSAIIFFGGVSVIEKNYDLSKLKELGTDFKIIAEVKSITPKLIQKGFIPDFCFMPYSEKAKTNLMHQIFIQALSVGFNLSSLLKKEYQIEWNNFRKNFSDFAEINNVIYPYKRFKVKKDVVLDNSPLDLIRKYDQISLIVESVNFQEQINVKKIKLKNPVYKFIFSKSVEKAARNTQVFNSSDSYNSAIIALFQAIEHMGFKSIYLLGLDMSILGQMEFSPIYLFKSMRHFDVFHKNCRSTYSGAYPLGWKYASKLLMNYIISILKNRQFNIENYRKAMSLFLHHAFGLEGKYLRTKKEFKEFGNLVEDYKIYNITNDYNYSKKIAGLESIDYQDFLKIAKL